MTRLAWLLALAIAIPSDVPPPLDTEASKAQPLPAVEAARSFRLPPGFQVTLFASEPEVRNPIAMAWDARGRLWVAENDTYSERSLKFDPRRRDRVLIFTDADGDGRHDRRIVFTEDVQRLTSVELGLGGVWLMCPPQLLFVPDRNRDDVPDGPAEVVLDGFDVPAENYHNVANGLRWGPDGWLYGRCGASAPGEVGVPGTPKGLRVPLRGGLWRFDPKTKVFEALNSGTTNPWGHDWDEFGEPFFINTVNGHLWHAIPGAHFVRPHTIDPNPRAYQLIDQHADHFHWDTAKEWSDSRNASGEHDRRGGGHAHSGLMIYRGDRWPAAMRGDVFTLNFHGRRLNQDRLERAGSGYVGKHEPDPMFAADPFFRGIDLASGPDGNVFVLDWSDTGECHEQTGVHRSSGRIYKINYGGSPRPDPVDLTRLAERDLVKLQTHANDWFARQSRRELADRSARGEPLVEARKALHDLFRADADPVHKLRAVWSLYCVGGADEAFLSGLLEAEHESLRAWGIRLLTDRLPLDSVTGDRAPAPAPVGWEPPGMGAFRRMSISDPSGLVRLTLASTLQRLPPSPRIVVADNLGRHDEDATDHNLPLMTWYGLIPVADSHPKELASIAIRCKLPVTRKLIARRLAEGVEQNPAAVGELLARAAKDPSDALRLDILRGLSEGLKGWRKAPKPPGWDDSAALLAQSPDPAITAAVRELAVVFGDGRALDEVRRLALDDKADMASRRAALQTLIDNRSPDLRATCERLLKVRFLNATAVRGLALFDDPAIGKALAASYRTFHPSERVAVLDTLASRPAFARSLLDAVGSGAIPRGDLTAFHARQVRSHGDAELLGKLAEVWGELRDSPSEKKAQVVALKARLTPEVLARADRGRGRAMFNKACSTCHTLYGHGGQVGPDLTGAGRDNLDYLLENLVDPGATVGADFRMTVVAMADGRVLNGMIRGRTDRAVTLQTQDAVLVLPKGDIEAINPSPLSLMPEGILAPLDDDQVRDLIAYLQGRSQVPLPEGGR